MRKAKVSVELNVARDVKYISIKRKIKENVGLMVNQVGAW